MASDWQGVSIAFGGTIFDPTPSWTRVDTVVRVPRITIRRGRRNEFERTDAGECTVTFHDPAGALDPTSPGLGHIDSKPLAIAIRDPVAGEWFPLFRGQVEDWGYELRGSQVTGNVTVTASDALAYFAGFKMAPGLAGDTPPVQSPGVIFYEDSPAGTVDVDNRIIQALTDANWPSGLWSVFSGNVRMQESVYSPGEPILQVIDDAADAEFPTVANRYIDRFGFFCFHGRLARFDPDTVAASATHWDFHRWKAGDGAAIAGDSSRAQLRPPFLPMRSISMVRNAAWSYPMGIKGEDMEAQIITAAGSISAHGYKPWEAPNLLIAEGVTTGLTANEECALFAEYIIDNYQDPRTRLDQVTLRPLHPSDPRAAATWELITGIDISDVIDVVVGHPGGGGVNEMYYVEGITYEISPLVKDLDTGYPNVTLTLDLSPTAYWTTNPF